ncbi:MAG: preprotein translocase subunit SecG [Phycisphaerae bacterium]|nr:preprotein translocase subunit SecG [Phycisphaerae bacterium]
MTVLPLLAVGILMKFAAVLFVLVSLILILVVLMQKGRGGGLSGAFGGGMASGLLGSKTGDFLTWVTIVLVSVFLVLAVVMARYYRPPVKFGQALPPASQQPLTSGQTATPQPGATEQPTPTPTAAPATTPSGQTQPSAPASQPSTPAPGASGTSTPATPGASTTPSADAGKTGG